MVNRFRPAGGRYSVARVLADLRQATLWDPTDVESLTLLAELEIGEGQHARGRAHLAAAWQALEACGEPRLSRRRGDVVALAVWSCREEGLVDDARSWLARGRRAAPGDPELALLEGLVLVEEGRIVEAMAAAARLSPVSYFEIVNSTGLIHRERNETGAPSRWLRAMALWRDGRADLAWHALQPLRWDQAYLPYASRFWQDVGLIAETAGRPEAAQAYARARHSHPFRTGIVSQAFAGPPSVLDLPQRSLPFIVGCAGDYAGGSLFAYACKAASSYFEDPGDASAPQALTHARNVLAICRRRGIHPDHARAMLGRLEYVAGRHDVAEKDLLAASAAFARLGKVDGTTEWLLGLVRLEAEDPAVARTRLAAAVAADPTLGLAWSTLGAAQAALGDSASARVSMDRSVELRPHNSSVWFNRGLLRARGGDLAGGRADLEVAARAVAPVRGGRRTAAADHLGAAQWPVGLAEPSGRFVPYRDARGTRQGYRERTRRRPTAAHAAVPGRTRRGVLAGSGRRAGGGGRS